MDLLNSDGTADDTNVPMTEEEQDQLLNSSQDDLLQIENDEDFSDDNENETENRNEQNLPKKDNGPVVNTGLNLSYNLF